jgi:hypothetical protein
MQLLAIDIGIYHLGLVMINTDDMYTTHSITWCELIDITACMCTYPCKLHHSNFVADRMMHVFTKYNHVFESVDKILIEQQPPQGLTSVEQLIFFKYRHKSVLVHPCSVHKWMRWHGLGYEQRKEQSVITLMSHVNINAHHLMPVLSTFDRTHDIADAYCLSLLYMHRQFIIAQSSRRIQMESTHDYAVFLEKFRYKPTVTLDDSTTSDNTSSSSSDSYHNR